MSLPLRPHVINRLRANILRGAWRPTTFPISAMGQRLHSQYRVEPVPRDLIPSRGQSKQQILWLGCSDSGYDETTILDLLPDEMIVIRNFGNMALSTDLAWSSAVQHAIDNLQVKHIIVCGHYGCGTVTTEPTASLSFPWQRKLSSLLSMQQKKLESLPPSDRNRYFVQVNVIEQMKLVKELLEIINPAEHRQIEIHGFLYDRMRKQADRILLNE